MPNHLAVALCAALAASGASAPLAAQWRTVPVPRSLMAIAHNDLSFGTVLPGIPSTVPVFDRRKAALFEVQGPADAAVRVELLLPGALENETGDFIPLTFGATDGFADFSRGAPPRGLQFNPHAPLTASLGPNGRLWVRLGGTVTPGRPQARGLYTATIHITVFDLST